MIEDTIAHRHLRVGAQIIGEGEQIRALGPHSNTLNVGVVDGELVAECNSLQSQVAAILDPAVAKGIVAHGITIDGTWHIGDLSFVVPAREHSCGLVHEATAALELLANVVVDVSAEAVVEADVERETLVAEARPKVTINDGIGITDKDTLEIPVEFVPDKEVEKEVLFRFSKYFGIVDADDLSGVPYYITVVNQHNVPVNTTTVGKDEKIKDDAGIWVNLPGKISVKLYQGEKLLENFETYVAQFGRTEPMMGELFSKKMETKVRLNPATGNADSINTELRK